MAGDAPEGGGCQPGSVHSGGGPHAQSGKEGLNEGGGGGDGGGVERGGLHRADNGTEQGPECVDEMEQGSLVLRIPPSLALHCGAALVGGVLSLVSSKWPLLGCSSEWCALFSSKKSLLGCSGGWCASICLKRPLLGCSGG